MNKGIVMEITKKNIIVMRPDGRFQRLARKRRNCEIGEEITFADEGINWRSPSVAGRSAIVAAVVFCLVLFASFQGKLGSSEVVAYISIDINPSVELGIDSRERVLELWGLNEDGAELIRAVDYKKKPLETVTAGILNQAEQKAFSKGEAEIVIASTVIEPSSKISDSEIAEKLRLQVKEYIQTSHPTQVESYQIASFAAPQEVREAARENGVSMGKYAVYLNAKSSGAAVTLEDLKTQSVLKISKTIPEVALIMTQENIPTKAAIRQLMEEEKSGELDKKLRERLKERTMANTNSSKEGDDAKTDSKKQTVPSVEGKKGIQQGDDAKDDAKNASPIQFRPGSGSSPGAGGSGTVRQGDRNSGRDDDEDDRKNKVRDQQNDRKSGFGNEDKKSDEERRQETAKLLEELKKKEEEARKKAEELREKAEEQRRDREEAIRERLEEEKRKIEEQRKKDEEKRKEQEKKEGDGDKKKRDDDKKEQNERKSKDEDKTSRQEWQKGSGGWTNDWQQTVTWPFLNYR